MAETSVQPIHKSQPIAQTMLSGRVESVRSFDNKIYTTVICPSKDAFSMPSVFEVSSKRRFCEVGQDFTPCLFNISGYVKSFDYTDKKSGEVKPGRKANVYFELVE